MPVKGPENAETARLCVITLFGEAASVTSTYVCSSAAKRLSTRRAAATTSLRRRLSPRRRRSRTKPARSTGSSRRWIKVVRPFEHDFFARRDDDVFHPRVRVRVVGLGHAPVDDVVCARRRAGEESKEVSHLLKIWSYLGVVSFPFGLRAETRVLRDPRVDIDAEKLRGVVLVAKRHKCETHRRFNHASTSNKAKNPAGFEEVSERGL